MCTTAAAFEIVTSPAAIASPRRGREGAAAAASWRNRVRAIVGAL